MPDIGADAHEALTHFLYMAPIGLVQTRLDGEILMVNPLCTRLLMPPSPEGTLENLFRTLADVAPDLALRAQQFGPTHGMVCGALQLPVRAGPAHGHAHGVLLVSLLKLDSERLMAMRNDVTQAMRRELELQQNQAWIGTIANSISDHALRSLGPDGEMTCWNPRLARVTVFDASAIDGRGFDRFDPEGRMPAEMGLQRWQRQPRPLSLVAIDADHFKQVNDRFGHAAGDAVLRHLAAGLGATVRNLDLVARSGGEEFVVLLPGTGLGGAMAAAERLCCTVAAQVVDVHGVPIRCTVSAGVAAMHDQTDGLQALTKRADLALCEAKAQGRNRVERWRPGRRHAAVPVPVN